MEDVSFVSFAYKRRRSKTMADAVATSLKKLFSAIHQLNNSSHENPVELQDQERGVAESFDVLMNHLNKMMQNEQVQGLFIGMEQEVAQQFSRLTLGDRILETCEELCYIRYGPNVVYHPISRLSDKESTMADALAPLLKKLLRHIEDYDYDTEKFHTFYIIHKIRKRDNRLFLVNIHRKRRVSESFEALVNHLRTMMVGYENEQVQGLFEKLERGMADHLDRPSEHDIMLESCEKLCNMISCFIRYHLQTMMLGYENAEVQVISMSDVILETCEKLCNIRYGSNTDGREIVVGFDEEVKTLLDQLTGISIKQLQVISIAGMAGLGKTTLARKLYTDLLIEYVFDIRAWTCVSQVYLKRDLLLDILGSFINDLTDEIYKMSDEQLGEKLYRRLKDHKYLVVLDDIWDCKAWNDLKIYFPDDNNGSRVLFTSRDKDVSLHVGAAHVLRLRTPDESWDIFRKKVFTIGMFSDELVKIGREISNKCEGLPLAIVITAGLLKNKWSDSWWREIAQSLHSFMARDPSQYMDSLDLSYNHLPPHLRPCFVFVGVFPEDHDIPVTKLIWLWVAQGFIHQTGSRILEDVAEDFLMDLINRSLLMIAKNRADGQIKKCRIHDLLRDLCLRKAKEEKFCPQIYKDAPVLATAWASSSTISNPYELPTHSGFCYPFELGKVLQEGGSVISETYKSLRILNVESVTISSFPSDVIHLANLRYLAIQARDGSPQASISNLVNLQMLIISSRKNIVVPKTIWDMLNLRHLYMKAGENLIEDPSFVQMTDTDSCPNELACLQTLSQISPQSCQNIFSRTPNLRKLGVCGPLISRQGELEIPNIRSVKHLQKLKLSNTIPYPKPTRLLNTLMFPEELRKLTLSNTGMDWEDLWALSLLPNLEALKLQFHACIGKEWKTSDAEFQRLKILKLHGLNLGHWVCSRDNFPRLQRLVVRQCLNLKSIPSDLGKIYTLEVIEVHRCSKSAQVSALKIQEEQEMEDNFLLKVHATYNFEESC